MALCSIPFYLICNMTSVKKCFDLLIPPQGTRVCERTEFVLTRCSSTVPINLKYIMTTFRKKMFGTFTPLQWSKVCVRAEYMLACCCNRHSPLICNMTMFSKVEFQGQRWGGVYGQNICYHFAACFNPIHLKCSRPYSEKV